MINKNKIILMIICLNKKMMKKNLIKIKKNKIWIRYLMRN